MKRKKRNMKTIEETIQEIKKLYKHHMYNRDINRALQNENEENHRWKDAKAFEEYADMSQARMDELVSLYSFITGILWTDTIKELRK